MAARVIMRPLSAAPRAPTAALPAGSGRSPRTLGGVRSAMSPTGETPPGRRQGDKSKRLRSHNPAPLPARNQAEIFSVCFQQEPHVNKVLLLFVAHAYCALAGSRSMLPHAIAHHTPLHNVHHCTLHTTAHGTPLHTAHHCTLHTIVRRTRFHLTPLRRTALHIVHYCTS